MGYRLFISHSSHDPQAQQRLADLAEALEAAAQAAGTNIRAIYDRQQIAPSDDWRQRIAFMLHAAHGAVVLLDQAAFASPWVAVEASFLAMRQAVNPSRFRVFPVPLYPDAAALDAVFDGLRGTAWDDVARLTDRQFALGRTPEQVAAAIVAALQQAGVLAEYLSPADRLAGQLAVELGAASAADLDDLADAAIAELPAAERERFRGEYLTGTPADRAGLALVRHMMAGGTLARAKDLLRGLGRGFAPGRRATVLSMLAPLRFDGEAAAGLALQRASGGYVHALLRAGEPGITVEQYIIRAHVPRDTPDKFPMPGSDGSFEGLRAALRAEWQVRYGTRWQLRHPGRPLTSQVIDDLLNDEPRYVWLPGPIDDRVLGELESSYPRIAFVVHVPEDPAGATRPPRLRLISPSLEPDREREIIRDLDSALLEYQGAT